MTTTIQRIRIFEYALNQEQTGISFFRQSLDRLGVGAAVSAFRKLIVEEEGHIRFISSILQDLKKGADLAIPDASDLAIAPTDYFDERGQVGIPQAMHRRLHDPRCDSLQYSMADREGSKRGR